MFGRSVSIVVIALAGIMLPAGANAQNSAACRSSCEGVLDRSNNANSAAVQRRYNECLSGCNRRAKAESAYRACMSGTKRVGLDGRPKTDQGAVQRCQASYQANR